MMWFGTAHGAPYEADTSHAPTPVGVPCGRCGEPIEAGDDGLLVLHVEGSTTTQRPYHYVCHVRGLIGGLNHIVGRCTCCGGTEPPDPPGMSKREAALAAVCAWEWQKRRIAQ